MELRLGGGRLSTVRDRTVHRGEDEAAHAHSTGNPGFGREADHRQRLVEVADGQEQVRLTGLAGAGDVVLGLPPSGLPATGAAGGAPRPAPGRAG